MAGGTNKCFDFKCITVNKRGLIVLYSSLSSDQEVNDYLRYGDFKRKYSQYDAKYLDWKFQFSDADSLIFIQEEKKYPNDSFLIVKYGIFMIQDYKTFNLAEQSFLLKKNQKILKVICKVIYDEGIEKNLYQWFDNEGRKTKEQLWQFYETQPPKKHYYLKRWYENEQLRSYLKVYQKTKDDFNLLRPNFINENSLVKFGRLKMWDEKGKLIVSLRLKITK